jgi:hypothetical protein
MIAHACRWIADGLMRVLDELQVESPPALHCLTTLYVHRAWMSLSTGPSTCAAI